MSDIGRIIAASGLLKIATDRADQDRRAADEWRRLHRRPDAPPPAVRPRSHAAARARHRAVGVARRLADVVVVPAARLRSRAPAARGRAATE